ncbi:expressed unknown protein [Seminavis robusta]|uniref:Uncharacterized protein n=1 Tax=Seminavis robusta TaxID=568900 RepID=A0A9N8F117_9STRA|nr:expressed unknown protein [Seminavis robusta]|eukprot:Sro2445_g327880.1 n/a (82) ;mRNA; f:3537-3782
MTASGEEARESEGSWIPLIVILVLVFLRWLAYGTGSVPIRFRRWYNIQRVQLRKQLGYRDESIYRPGTAGDGASKKHKRQG